MPFFGVVAVGIGGRNIEVAEQDQFFVAGHFVADKFGQSGKPLFFILEFRTVEGFAVDAIDIDDAHAVDGCGDDAALRIVGQGGQTDVYVLRFAAADDGDAVVGFLSAPNAVPAHHLQGGGGKFVLVELEFLQNEDIGLMVGKPVLHLRQAHVEGIDVPSSDFHADSVCEGRLKSVSGFSGKIRTKQKRFMQNRFVG